MPELTSLKVPVQVRDRFAVAAEARGMTVRALLEELSRRALDEALMAEVAVDMAKLRDRDPGQWSDYLDEGREWEEGSVERLGAEAG